MEWKKSSKILAAVMVMTSSILFIPSANADSFSWTSPSPISGLAGYSAALSSDGSVMLIGESSTGLYLSTDTGTTFTQVSSPNVTGSRYAVAVSGDGQKMFAVNYSDTSVAYSLDRGATWSRYFGVAASAGAACMSSDGSVWMTGGLNSANAYVSTNNGTSWSTITSVGLGSWRSCALSSNGTKRYILNYNNNLWISNNSGTNWSQSTYSIVNVSCVAASDDGSFVIQTTAVASDYVYKSNSPLSGGFTTYPSSGTGGSPYGSCSMSGTGSTMAVGRMGYKVRLSLDTGATWSDESSVPNGQWINVVVSRDGKKAIALSSTAIGNYIGSFTPPMALTMGIGAASVLTYRTTNTITVNSNYPGLVTFFANGKKIGKCVSIPTVSLTATCAYSPTIHGTVTLTARIVPTDNTKSTVSTAMFKTSVVKRTNTR